MIDAVLSTPKAPEALSHKSPSPTEAAQKVVILSEAKNHCICLAIAVAVVVGYENPSKRCHPERRA
jgi:hypothetical protein